MLSERHLLLSAEELLREVTSKRVWRVLFLRRSELHTGRFFLSFFAPARTHHGPARAQSSGLRPDAQGRSQSKCAGGGLCLDLVHPFLDVSWAAPVSGSVHLVLGEGGCL